MSSMIKNKIHSRWFPAHILMVCAILFFAFPVTSPVAYAANCECEVGKGCTCNETTLLACVGSIAGHPATIASIEAFVTALINTHKDWLRDTFFKDGIIAGLRHFAEQVTTGHFDQAKARATIKTHQMHDDGKRTLQVNKAQIMMEVMPSEHYCDKVTIVSGLAGAEADSQRVVEENMLFLEGDAAGDKNMPSGSGTRHALESRMDVMCKYADPKMGGGALERACPTMPSEGQNFLAASIINGPSITEEQRESLQASTMALFYGNQPDPVSKEALKNDNLKMAYMQHRAVLARQNLAARCFQKTFQDKFGGNDTGVPQLEAQLKRVGLTDPAEIAEKLGDAPSAHARKALSVEMSMTPNSAIKDTIDTKGNILRAINLHQSNKMISLYDSLEALHCQELMLSQILNDRLRGVSVELQERLDTLQAYIDEEKGKTNWAKHMSPEYNIKGGG